MLTNSYDFNFFPHLGTPIPDFEVLVAITKKNLVASSVLSKDASRKVDFDFESHKTFPVVKLVQWYNNEIIKYEKCDGLLST